MSTVLILAPMALQKMDVELEMEVEVEELAVKKIVSLPRLSYPHALTHDLTPPIDC